MIQGMLYIISAPSGTGKSALIYALLEKNLLYNTKLAISYTTRAMRPGEIHGKDYYFIALDEFNRLISENAFLEYAKIFGNYYGTAIIGIEEVLATGIDIFLDINWEGAQQIRSKISNVRSIFILPPSKDELNRRLRIRGQDNEKIISNRMKQAISDIMHFTEYDYLIVNDDFDTALSDLKSIIQSKALCINRQKLRYNILINNLLLN